MKRPIVFLLLVILLAGGAIGAMSGPSSAQGYYYQHPTQNVAVTPYVGNNTPWTFYKGDWFLNGILQYFFGPRIGFAPYYAYPQVYIVRPNNWYAPGWNSWYQGHPQYWNNFERQHPEWRGHQVGQHYDQNFYNRYHSGQGGGWNQGSHGVSSQGGTGTGYRSQGATGTSYRTQGTTGTGYRSQGATGTGVRTQGTTGTGVRTQGTTGTALSPKAPASSAGKPGTPPYHEEKH